MIQCLHNGLSLSIRKKSFRKTITVLLCCGMLIFLISCGGSNPAGSPEQTVYNSGYIDDSTYINPVLGFQINAPHEWSISLQDQSKDGDSTILATCIKELPQLSYDGILEISVLFSKNSIESNALIQELSNIYMNDTSWRTITVDSSVTSTVGTFSGVWFEVSGNRGNSETELKVIQFIFKIDTYNVLITVMCPSSIYEQEKDNITASFQSLKKLQ